MRNNSKKTKNSAVKTFFDSVKKEMRENKITFAVYVVMRLLVALILVLQIINGNFENAFLCVLTLVLLLAPGMLQTVFEVDFPSTLEIIIMIFIFSAEILGEISDFYGRFQHWDTVLHTLNGFLCAAIGFSLVDILNRNDKFHMELSPLFVAIVAFCFSMTIGVLWEFFEFLMDWFFGLDMQKDTIIHKINSMLLSQDKGGIYSLKDINSIAVNGKSIPADGYVDIGLIDTMEDLFVNFVGAIFFSVAGYFYIKKRKSNSIIKRFVPWIKQKELQRKDGEN